VERDLVMVMVLVRVNEDVGPSRLLPAPNAETPPCLSYRNIEVCKPGEWLTMIFAYRLMLLHIPLSSFTTHRVAQVVGNLETYSVRYAVNH
jgi:hypothetical protein